MVSKPASSTQTNSVKINPAPHEKSKYNQEIAKIAVLVSNISNKPDEMASVKKPSSLSELAAEKYFSHLTPDNKSWASDFIKLLDSDKIIFSQNKVLNAVKKTVFKQLQSCENPQINFDIASARVKNGESCTLVAEEHGIPTDSEAFHKLQMLVVEGRTRERVRNDESCISVAQAHGIRTDSIAFNILQMFAAGGAAGRRVGNGESWTLVAQQHGISYSNAIRILRVFARPVP